MELGLVYARARNGVIGNKGSLPWRIPQDMAHFKAITLGHPVIMGRKTWDSLLPRFRPLHGRLNIVLTRQPQWRAEGAQAADSLIQAIALCKDASRAWVIGGAEIYAQALPLASQAEVTEIEQDFEGDAFAPTLGPQWMEVARSAHATAAGLHFSFVTYRKTRAGE